MNGGALHEVVAKTLRERPDRQFTPEEIARLLIELYPDRFKRKELSLGGREALISQVTREIYAQRPKIVRRHSDIAVDLSKRPLRMFATVDSGRSDAQISPPISEPVESGVAEEVEREELRERSLYEPLQRFLADEMTVLSKRIRESTSKNKRGRHGNKWLHPDIVGMSAPAGDWSELIKQCAIALPTRKARLYLCRPSVHCESQLERIH